jgi:hypothetical protein
MICVCGKVLSQTLDFAHWRQVDGEFIFSIDTNQGIHSSLLICQDRTGPSTDCFTCKVKVLADVTRLDCMHVCMAVMANT